MPSTIYIDTREKERPHPADRDLVTGVNMLELFRSHRTSPAVEPFFLQSGDFFFSGHGPDPDSPATFGVERKRLKDLLSSKRLGRIQQQAAKMHEIYDFRFLIVEGSFRTNWLTGMLEIPMGKSWGPLTIGRQTFVGLEIESLLNELAVCGGFTIKRTRDAKETVEYVLSLHHTFTKPWDKHESCVSLYQPAEFATVVKSSDVRRAVYALRCGIGWDKSKTIDQHYPSVDSLCRDTPKQIAKLDGIGPVLANRIYKALHGKDFNQDSHA